MILSRKWLNEFVDCSATGDREFSEAMTLSGSKVETYENLHDGIQNVVAGRILEMVRHTNSDHMWVCQVDVGQDAPIQIVTGAQNQKAGDLVPVALDGSILPGGVEIHAGVLRGEESNGMICSLKELGLTLHDYPYAIEDGLWIMQEEGVQPGDDIAAVIGADDHVIEFEITPNRPDCLSVIGLAREAAVTFHQPLKLHTPVVKGCEDDITNHVSIRIDAPELCPRYTARMVRNVKIAPSPAWMRERLRNSGVRPINNIVDITNYVMLEYGQPMHAFDFSCIDGKQIIIRNAREGETIQTLDGNARKLTPSMLCICDEQKPVAVAGVMGGANSEIEGDTAMVVFESANFNGPSVRRTATALGMRTEASGRFEKGLDPMNTMAAVDRACELVELLGCGEVMQGVIDVMPKPFTPTTVKLEPEKVNGLLGTDVSEAEMRRILLALGFGLDGDTIIVPSWRSDVEHYSDIAEEVARFYGYNNIPNTLMRGQTTSGGYTDRQNAERRLGSLARTLGYNEIITYSFISPSYYDKIALPADSPLRNSMKILNPLGEDTSIMRTTILPSMLEILTRNYNYRNKSVKLYELGKIYFAREDGMADEPKMLCLGAYGSDMNFFKLKGAVESILGGLRVEGLSFEADSTNPSYHPGRCAKVFAGETKLGVIGQIHPRVAANYGVDTELYTAELKLDAMLHARGATPVYVPLPRFPAVTRDIAVVCDAALPVARLEACILGAGGQYLKRCELFDVYTGAPIPAGMKSVAFSLELRADDQTLTDEHADETMSAVLTALKETCNASIR
ncbi:MAG: phenylalanine--tRNA ligase subunit beta [Oscillospiraceae bacterium]|nr:phenylalanine--tRNA ligase subunit beta [Oscillospiraceae bacterium]